MLGRFEVRVGERLIDERGWHLRKAADVVKLLALAADQTLTRDRLLELLWPDRTPFAANNNLRQAVYVARHVLDDASHGQNGFLVRRGQSLRLTATTPAMVDVEAFEAAARVALRTGFIDDLACAVELYTGELLPDDAYEEWTLLRRRALVAIYIELLTALASEYAAADRTAAAIETLERLIILDPASEHGHAELMRLRALSGDRRGALLEYGELRRELKSELDLPPSEATERLRDAILGDILSPAGASRRE